MIALSVLLAATLAWRAPWGVLLPDSGVLKLDGAPLDSGDRAGRRHIGYVPEANDAMPHLSVAELLRDPMRTIRTFDVHSQRSTDPADPIRDLPLDPRAMPYARFGFRGRGGSRERRRG